MNHLHGTGSRNSALGITANSMAGGQHQDWADTFSAGKNRIAHRLVQAGWTLALLGEVFVQRLVNACNLLFQIAFQIHVDILFKRALQRTLWYFNILLVVRFEWLTRKTSIPLLQQYFNPAFGLVKFFGTGGRMLDPLLESLERIFQRQ